MPRYWKRNEDGTAPKEAEIGDLVVTNGGTYKVGDKSYEDKSTNTYNFTGAYANAENPNQPKPATVPPAVKQNTLDYSGALQQLYGMSQRRSRNGAYGGSEWDDRTRQLINQALGMDYGTWAHGDQYKALAQRYGEQGAKAMDETVAQIAARTGGLASSYAGVAGQQQYNEYMKRLEDAARQRFAQDRADAIENASLAQGMGQDLYQRWLQEQSRRGDERDAQLRLLQAIASDAGDQEDRAFRKEQFEYGKEKDATEDERAERKLAYDRLADKAALLATAGNYSGYAELFGLEEDEVQALVDNYAAQKGISADKAARELAKWYAEMGDFDALDAMDIVDTANLRSAWANKNAPKKTGGRSGGGGGGGNQTEFDWSAIDEMAETKSAGYIENYLEINYKRLGFKSAAAAKAAWENHLEDIEGESGADDTGEVGFKDVYGYAKQMIANGASQAEVDNFLKKAKKRGLIGNEDGLSYGFDFYHYYGD